MDTMSPKKELTIKEKILIRLEESNRRLPTFTDGAVCMLIATAVLQQSLGITHSSLSDNEMLKLKGRYYEIKGETLNER